MDVVNTGTLYIIRYILSAGDTRERIDEIGWKFGSTSVIGVSTKN